MDEETKVPKGTDEGWLAKLDQNFSKHVYFVKPKTSRGVFGIKVFIQIANSISIMQAKFSTVSMASWKRIKMLSLRI